MENLKKIKSKYFCAKILFTTYNVVKKTKKIFHSICLWLLWLDEKEQETTT